MTNKQKIDALNKIIDMAKTISVHDSDNPDFKNWKYLCVRTLISIYGEKSSEAMLIANMKFYYNPGIMVGGRDYSREHLTCFNRDFEQALKLIELLKSDFEGNSTEEIDESEHSINKIFISHSSKDVKIVEEFVDLVETIGLDSNQIVMPNRNLD